MIDPNEIEIFLDGAGGAFAIDHSIDRVNYKQALGANTSVLRYQALRSVIPHCLSDDGDTGTELPDWGAIMHLEVVDQVVLVLLSRRSLGSPACEEQIKRYDQLVRDVLGWRVLPVPFESETPPVGSDLFSTVLSALQADWKIQYDRQIAKQADQLQTYLKAPYLDRESERRVAALASVSYATHDYPAKRLASFVHYYATHPAGPTNASAVSFHLGALDGCQLAESVADAIRTRTPFSFVRVGEGEGCFLSYAKYRSDRSERNEVFGICAKDIYRIWFDRSIHDASDAEFARIRDVFWQAMSVADVIGVPTPHRVVHEYAHFIDEVAQHGYSRGYVGVAEILSHLDGARSDGQLMGKRFTDCDIARPLYEWQDWSTSLACTLPHILKGRHGVTLITCHPGLERGLARMLDLKSSRTLLIPPERGRVKGRGLLSGDHFNDHFDRISDALRNDCGAIVVVAAGFLGKAYCGIAKAAGGVAIDIGSLADYWVGFSTRAKNSWSIPSPFSLIK
jgi:hypothetical protein